MSNDHTPKQSLFAYRFSLAWERFKIAASENWLRLRGRRECAMCGYRARCKACGGRA